MSAVELEEKQTPKMMDNNTQLMNKKLLSTQKYECVVSDLK